MISDSLPERRNLVITSMAFIVFHAAGGHVVEHSLTLPATTIEFTRPQVLVLFAWVLLLAFAIRFWQSTRGMFRESFFKEMEAGPVPPILRPRARAQVFAASPDIDEAAPPGRLRIFGFRYEKGLWIVHFGWLQKERGRQALTKQGRVAVSGWPVGAALVWATFRQAVANSAISIYILPYILFVAAVLSPWWAERLSI